jgi:hypothetical protein
MHAESRPTIPIPAQTSDGRHGITDPGKFASTFYHRGFPTAIQRKGRRGAEWSRSHRCGLRGYRLGAGRRSFACRSSLGPHSSRSKEHATTAQFAPEAGTKMPACPSIEIAIVTPAGLWPNAAGSDGAGARTPASAAE